MRYIEFKHFLFDKTNSIIKRLNTHDKMQIAINLKISFEIVKKYTSGKIEDFRSLQTAERIMDEAERIVSNK
jgi:hypothetical protein